MPDVTHARLRAIVALGPSKSVRCQQPGCHQAVHAAVHVVEEAGQLMVLGSTCFAKRYGSGKALGPAQHGAGGGAGLSLTDEERQLLIDNTAALLAQFEEQDRAQAETRARAAAARPDRQGLLRKQAVPPRAPLPSKEHIEELIRKRHAEIVRLQEEHAKSGDSSSPWS